MSHHWQTVWFYWEPLQYRRVAAQALSSVMIVRYVQWMNYPNIHCFPSMYIHSSYMMHVFRFNSADVWKISKMKRVIRLRILIYHHLNGHILPRVMADWAEWLNHFHTKSHVKILLTSPLVSLVTSQLDSRYLSNTSTVFKESHLVKSSSTLASAEFSSTTGD